MPPTSQSHELTPLVWVGLAIAGLTLAIDALSEQTTIEMLATREGEKQVIIRSQNQTHQFPLLGVQVASLPGWSYLAVSEDPLADRPAFVHEASNSLVRLQPDVFGEWPPEGLAKEPVSGKHPTGDLEWVRADHLRLGKLQWAEFGLIIVAIQHDSKAELNDTINEFCTGIGRIGTEE
jgi:hypothetical protein